MISLGETAEEDRMFTGSPQIRAQRWAGPAARTAAEPIRPPPGARDGPSPAVRWPEIQAAFVDDPHACLELAARVIGDSVSACTESIQERQHTLLSSWQRDDTGTEELRVALQHYRTFWNHLEDIRWRSLTIPN
jgi:hypothetical protein